MSAFQISTPKLTQRKPKSIGPWATLAATTKTPIATFERVFEKRVATDIVLVCPGGKAVSGQELFKIRITLECGDKTVLQVDVIDISTGVPCELGFVGT